MILYSKHKKAVLLFHRILPERDLLWDPIDPALFAQSLRYITKKFHIVSLNELLFEPETYSSKPKLALTFDDGYRDFIDYAIPLLDKWKLTASMFIVTDCIDSGLPTWTYIIDYLFTNSQKLEWTNYDVDELPEEYRKVNWNTKDEKIGYCRKFKQYLKWIPSISRDSIIKSLLLNFNDIESPGNMMMSWDEVKQIHNGGFQIGSHSVTHPTLATIADEGIIGFELNYSAKRIKEKTGIETEIFSYPIGSYDNRVKKLTKAAGYKAALAVNYKMYDPTIHDLFEVPRIELYSESWLKTRMRINGSASYIQQLLKK
jgi:peptidoglycan/xylan/chitin deacetylase (PgdA/CDA1 family)